MRDELCVMDGWHRVGAAIVKQKGKFISGFWENNVSVYKVECRHGHIFSAQAANLKATPGKWCGRCGRKRTISEQICRYVLEQALGYPLPLIRHAWLRTPQYRTDGFNEEKNVAFEHQGRQHTEVIKFYKGSEERLGESIKKDKLKSRLCKKRGVRLIVITSIERITNYEKIIDRIASAADRAGVRVDRSLLQTIDMHVAKVSLNEREAFEATLKSQGAKCLSLGYLVANLVHKVLCKNGHVWEVSPSFIYKGAVCDLCVTESS